MKPVQVGLLIALGVLGGVVVTKWLGSPSEKTTSTAIPATPTPATPEPSQLSSRTQPSEPLPPPPVAEREPRPSSLPSHKASKPTQRAAARAPEHTTPPAPIATTPAPGTPAPATTTPNVSVPETPSANVEKIAPTEPLPPPPQKVTLASGTQLSVRLGESLSSERNHPGDTFSATLVDPLVVDGFVIAERGARLEGRVVESKQAGRVQGLSAISLELTRLTTSDGQRVPISTETFEKAGPSSKGGDAAKIGAAAGIGAAIGAIAGGGKGAAIGAGVGGAAGTGGVLATRGKAAELPTETKIGFRLRNSVTVTEKRSSKSG